MLQCIFLCKCDISEGKISIFYKNAKTLDTPIKVARVFIRFRHFFQSTPTYRGATSQAHEEPKRYPLRVHEEPKRYPQDTTFPEFVKFYTGKLSIFTKTRKPWSTHPKSQGFLIGS